MFKTIYSRFGNVKTNKFAASYEDQASGDYNSEDFENLNDIETVLDRVGIKLRENASTWRDIDLVLEDIAANWKNWDRTTQNAVATAVAGTRQRENVITLFENWDSVAKYTEIAENAYGTATEKMGAYTESVQASKERMTVAVEEWALRLNRSELIKKFYDGLTFVIENLDKLALVLGGFALLTNHDKIATNVGAAAGKIATKTAAMGNTFAGIKSGFSTGGISGALKSAGNAFIAPMETARINQQVTKYGEALMQACKSMDAQDVIQLQNIQTDMLMLKAKDRNLISQLMLGEVSEQTALSSVQALSLDTKKNLATALLTNAEEKSKAILEKLINTHKEEDFAAGQLADAEKALAYELKTQGKNSGFGTVQANLKDSVDPKKSVAAGIGTTAGGILGGVIGSQVTKDQSSTVQILGSTAGSALGAYAGKGLGAAASLLGKGVGAKAIASAAGAGPIAAAIILAIAAGRAIVKQQEKKRQQEAQEEFKELEEKLSSTKSMTAIAAKFDELSKGVDKFGRNVNLSEEDYQSFLETSNQLCDAIPQLTGYIDDQGNKIVDLGKNAQTAAECIEILTEAQQQAADAALIDPDVMGPAMEKAFAGYKDIYDKIQNAEYNVTRKQEAIEYYQNLKDLSGEEVYTDVLAALDLVTTGMTSDQDWLGKLKESFGGNEAKARQIMAVASQFLGPNFWGKDEEGRAVSINNARIGMSNYGRDLIVYTEEEIDEKITELQDELNFLTTTSGEALGVAQWKQELEQIEQSIAPYGQAHARIITDNFEGLDSATEKIITSLISNISMIEESETGGIRLLSQVEYTDKVEELVANLSKLFEENPVLVKVATEVEIAPTIKDEQVARQELLKEALRVMMQQDGKIGPSDLLYLEEMGFKHNGGSSYTANDFTDTTDKYQQLADALGISREKVANIWGNQWNWNVDNMSPEEFNKLFSYIKNGEVAKFTSKNTIDELMYSDSFGGDTLIGAQKYNKYLQDKPSADLKMRVKSFYDNYTNITKEDVANMFSDLPENLRNAILQGAEEGTTEGGFGAVWSDIQAAYDAALLGSYEQLAKIQASTYFGNIDAGTDEILGEWSEINDMLSQIGDAFDMLTAATKEFGETGKLSWSTILKLLSTNREYINALTIGKDGKIGFDQEAAKRITVDTVIQGAKDNIKAEIEKLETEKNTIDSTLSELEGLGSIDTPEKQAQLENLDRESKLKQKEIDYNKQLLKGLEGANTEEIFDDLYNSDRKTQLEKLKDGLGAINKEFQQMMAFSDMLNNSLDTTLDPNKADNFIDTNYYNAKRGYLQALITRAGEKLDGMTLGQIMKIEDDTERDEYLGYYQDYQNYKVEEKNLDDERVQDSINILKGQKADLSLVTAQYKNLIQTADTEEEYYEYYQQYLDAFMAEFDKKINDVQRNIDALEKSKPQEWKSTIDDNGKVAESATKKINDYYKQMDAYYNQQLTEARNALTYAAELTEEEINKLVDSANSALKSIRDNNIAKAEAIKEYQESVYNALRNEVERYIDELNKQKEVIEETYDKELEKLEDKEDAIARTNKLIELQNNLMTAQKEKERVYRAGVGWTYESNRNKVREAEKALNDFYRQDNIDDLNNAKDAELKNLEDRIKNWEDYLDMLEEKYKEYEILEEKRLLKELLNVETDEQIKNTIVTDMTNLITSIGENYTTYIENQDQFYLNYNSTFNSFLDNYKANLITLAGLKSEELELLDNSNYLEGMDALNYWKNTDFSALADAAKTEEEMLGYLALRDLKVAKYGLQGNIDSGEYRTNEKIADQWRAKHGYSSGILNGPVSYTGLAMLHGTPSNPEYVLNNDQAYNLLRYMATKKMPAFESTNCGNSGAQYIVQGDIVLEGVNNPQEFWGEVTKAMSNRWNVTKNR